MRPLALRIALAFSAALAYGQWQNTGFPLHGDIPALLIAGSDLYAASAGGGVYLSRDNGGTWIPLDSGLADKYVRCLAASGAELYAGAYTGVFASSDRGARWDIQCLARNGSDLFAGTASAGIFRSPDQGRTWARVDSASPALSLRSFLFTGAGLFAAAANGAYRSTDSGRHWAAINTGLDETSVESLAARGARLFAGTSGGLYVSADNGDHWTRSVTGLSSTYHDVPSLLALGTYLFAGTSVGVYQSGDDGAHWSEIGSGFTSLDFIQALAADGAYVFASVTSSTADNGVWRLPIPATGLVPRPRAAPVGRSPAWVRRGGARFTVAGRKSAD